MDGFIMDHMDPTLSELGDEFTLGDIDGKQHNKIIIIYTIIWCVFWCIVGSL